LVFEFKIPFRSEIAKFDEISAEIFLPVHGGISEKKRKG